MSFNVVLYRKRFNGVKLFLERRTQMAYDYSRLLGKIKEVFKTQSAFAKALGISERALSLKLTGKRMWNQPLISKACELLGIGSENIAYYFFTQKV